MPRIPYRFPAKGEDQVADRIRERRGPARGLTSLDGTLLNAPMVADGWNTFIGTLRQRNSLPDDVREILILRVAAVNRAAFEWVHHEHVGRHAGLTYEQLSLIGSPAPDDRTQAFEIPSSSTNDTLSPLQAAALKFADASTRQIAVPRAVFDELKTQLAAELEKNPGKTGASDSGPVTVERQLLEATTTVGAYNMVSRLLVALDVDDKSEMVTPIPVVAKVQVGASPKESLHAVYVPAGEPTGKTIILVNSLMTNYKMWRHVWDQLAKTYNVIMYDQRGHGGSFTPSTKCKLEDLADDVPKILEHFKVGKAHAVIGVSQGGATTLNVALKYPEVASKFISCDTQAKSPEANIKAWDDRIELAREEGMGKLAAATIPRWFANDSLDQERDLKWLSEGVESTSIDGFASSAGALQGYDLLSQGLVDALASRSSNQVLLVAGEFDGALPKGLQALADEVNAKSANAVQVEIIPGGGHLPMVNRATEWTEKVLAFLKQ
ncbi:hypothetical protein QFC21_003920 [Naganishia friedmannii]|uniref:Uncharacterized protein n=1 Tax=Naganishia friedmannii TaxID=89922 RepID=A0ACC2VLZ1_9TREE|nr:hypothetical protein QFC21_003920 [Naganishia friedmannii]